MALLFLDSFDHYQEGADALKKWTTAYTGVGAFQIEVGGGRCGSNALKLESTAFAHKGVVVGGTANKGVCGFAYKPQAFIGVGIIGGPGYGSSTQLQWAAYISADGKLNIEDGDHNLRASSAVDLLHLGVWHYLEFAWTIHASAGAIIARINNVEVINVSGIDLQYSSAGTTNWTTWTFASQANATAFFDDLYVLDDVNDGLTPALYTFLGDTRVEYLRPTADGAHTDWTVSGGGTHANAVDKDDDSNLTTPLIESNTVGHIDTNAYEDPTIGSGQAFGVQINILAKKDASGPRTIAPVVRSAGGTDAVGLDKSPPETTPTYEIQTYGRNPVTAGAWTIAQVAADQFGVKLTS